MYTYALIFLATFADLSTGFHIANPKKHQASLINLQDRISYFLGSFH